MATYSIILAWKIPWTEKSGGLTVHGTQWAPRDTHRDSRRERNSLLTLEVRTDSLDVNRGDQNNTIKALKIKLSLDTYSTK